MSKIILSICLFFILFPSFAQIKVPMTKENGIYTIPCKVNGIPLKFIFDTGASNVSISLTEARFMFKNGQLTEGDFIGISLSEIANGDIVRNAQIVLREIEISGLKLYNVRANIMPTSNASLLLGQSALEKLGGYQIEGSTLTILNKVSSYDYSKEYVAVTAEPQKTNLTFKLIEKPEEIDFSKMGTMKVYTNSLIYENSEMKSGTVHFAQNNKVDVISRVNAMCYKVRNGSIEGYLWAGWFAY